MTIDTVLHDAVPASIIVIDEDMQLIGWNVYSQNTVNGKSHHEMLGVNPFDRIHPDDVSLSKKAFLKTLYSDIEETVEFRMFHKNGPPYKWATAKTRKSVIEGKACVVAIVTETSALKRTVKLQEQFKQLQEMELLGQLTGGIAHEFNNLMFGILGNTELIIEQLDDSYQFIENIKDIHSLANRSAILTRQMLAFAQKQLANPKKISLNREIANLFPMLKSLIGDHIHFEWHPDSEEIGIHLDPSQLDEIVINLCLNSRDAIAGSGTITIATGRNVVDLNTCEAGHACQAPGDYARLSISDTGCGIAAKILPHIYEPFYSTKEIGHGTGLGLSSVYGILKQNHGYIGCLTEPGKGTTFSIYLPIHEMTTGDDDPGSHDIPFDWKDVTILLVEDEPTVLKMLKGVLAEKGVTMLFTKDAKTAVKISDQYPDVINLLVTDTVLPHMNGLTLSRQLQARRPELQTLFMSGFSQETMAPADMPAESLNVIKKPFSLKRFMDIVSRMLHANSNR
jgi:two-component system, cell cycle sensor histidine kinase and response regulator CckA